MAFGIGEALGLLSLLLGLTTTGIGVGKGVASGEEAKKQKAYEDDLKRTEKKNKELAIKQARRNMIAKTIGSKLDIFREPAAELEPYKPRDLSGFDTAQQITNAGAGLTSNLSQYAPTTVNALEGESGAGKEGDYTNPAGGGAVGVPVSPDSPEIDPSTGLAKKKNKYGDYLSTPRA
jgi:hypothetical protein